MTKRLITFLLGALIFLYCSPTGAYVLPGLQMLELMTHRIGKASAVRVTQQLFLLNGQAAVPTAALDETLSYRYPRSFRLESKSETVHRIHIVSDGVAITVLDNRWVSDQEDLWDRYKDILLYRSYEVLRERLDRSGVDVIVSSLGRYQGQPCHVLGARYPDLTAPQIWLEKDTFFPIRWIIPEIFSDGTLKLLEFRYQNWQKANKFWYPMQIRIFDEDRLVREILVERVQVTPTFEENMFDVEYLKNKFPISATGDSAAEPSQPSTIRKTIEDFKKRYE